MSKTALKLITLCIFCTLFFIGNAQIMFNGVESINRSDTSQNNNTSAEDKTKKVNVNLNNQTTHSFKTSGSEISNNAKLEMKVFRTGATVEVHVYHRGGNKVTGLYIERKKTNSSDKYAQIKTLNTYDLEALNNDNYYAFIDRYPENRKLDVSYRVKYEDGGVMKMLTPMVLLADNEQNAGAIKNQLNEFERDDEVKNINPEEVHDYSRIGPMQAIRVGNQVSLTIPFKEAEFNHKLGLERKTSNALSSYKVIYYLDETRVYGAEVAVIDKYPAPNKLTSTYRVVEYRDDNPFGYVVLGEVELPAEKKGNNPSNLEEASEKLPVYLENNSIVSNTSAKRIGTVVELTINFYKTGLDGRIAVERKDPDYERYEVIDFIEGSSISRKHSFPDYDPLPPSQRSVYRLVWHKNELERFIIGSVSL